MEVELNGRTIKIEQNLIATTRGIPALRTAILNWLGRIGITQEYITVEYRGTLNGSWAEVSWEVNGKNHFYKCQSQKRPADNLAAVEQLVHQEVLFIERGIKTFAQVMNQFALPAPEDIEISFNPRQILGVPENIDDLDYIKFKYREAAKKYHPDKGGDPEEFKKIKKAYEMLKTDEK